MRLLIQNSSLFPFAKELSPWSQINLSILLFAPKQSLIGLSVFSFESDQCVRVCLCVFPCRI